MHKTVVSDTSCFIILTNIDALELLRKTSGQIVTTPEVAEEFGEQLPDWVEIISASDTDRQFSLSLQVDKGEASAIALALEIKDCTIILDDHKARRVAENFGLEITGTIGIIVKAKLQGIIPSVKPYLAKISETNFRLTSEIEMQALKEAGEL